MIKNKKQKINILPTCIFIINGIILLYLFFKGISLNGINFNTFVIIFELCASIWCSISIIRKTNTKIMNRPITFFIGSLLFHFIYLIIDLFVSNGFNNIINTPYHFTELGYNTIIVGLYSYNLYIHLDINKHKNSLFIILPIINLSVTLIYVLISKFLFENSLTDTILIIKLFLPALALLTVTISNNSIEKSRWNKFINNKYLITTGLFMLVNIVGFITNIMPIITYPTNESIIIGILIAILPLIGGDLLIAYFFNRKGYKWFDNKLFIVETIIVSLVQFILLVIIL